jgi:hypothetical protein
MQVNHDYQHIECCQYKSNTRGQLLKESERLTWSRKMSEAEREGGWPHRKGRFFFWGGGGRQIVFLIVQTLNFLEQDYTEV